MVKSCCAYGCKNEWTPSGNIKFHKFPLNNPEKLKMWIQAVRRKNFYPSASSVLCSEHFKVEDYLESSLRKNILKRDAIPSVFRLPEHMAKHSPKRRRPLSSEVSFIEEKNPPDAVEYDEDIVVKEEISINYDDSISPQCFPPSSPPDKHQFEENIIVKEETLVNDDAHSTLTLQNSSSEISMKYDTFPTSTLDSSVSLSPSYEHEHKVNMKDAVSNIYDVILTPTSAVQDPVASRVRTPHSNNSLRVNQLLDRTISCLQDLKQKDDDECHLYGKLIAKKLRKVPELEREELMHEIDGLFLRAAQKRYH